MKNWTNLRDKLPHQVWPSLDSLHNSWLNDHASYEEQKDSTVLYLKSEIYGRFPNRYKKDTSSFFTSRNLHVQLTFDVYNALKDAFHVASRLIS